MPVTISVSFSLLVLVLIPVAPLAAIPVPLAVAFGAFSVAPVGAQTPTTRDAFLLPFFASLPLFLLLFFFARLIHLFERLTEFVVSKKVERSFK